MQVTHLQQKLACHQEDSHSTLMIDEILTFVGLTYETLKISTPIQFILETRIDMKSSKPSSACFKEWLSLCKS